MLLGALIGVLPGVGRPVGVIGEAVDALGLPVRLDVSTTSRAGLAATRVRVITGGDVGAPGGDDDGNENSGNEEAEATPHTGHGGHAGGLGDGHVRRTWPDVRRLLTRVPLADTVREQAVATFAALAEAEAVVHGIPADDVHFHEVGALDALADVVGVCAGIAALGLDRLVVSAVALGGGSARTEHGVLPIPGPAVLELLQAAGLPGYGGPVDVELCTPTGAALVATHADAFGPLPLMRVHAIGVGAGRRDTPGRPNVVRLVVGSVPLPDVPAAGARAADIPVAVDELLIETNIDDLDPRAWPEIIATLLAAGARDAWLTPMLMKKGRPAHTLSVLVQAPHANAVRRLLFLHTPTLGLRETAVRKRALDRAFRSVDVGGETVAVKIGMLADGRVVTAQPEWDDVQQAAARLDQPTRWVLAAATAAALNTDGTSFSTADRGISGDTGISDDTGTGDDRTQTDIRS